MPLAESEGAGGELGRFTQAQRVLSLDPHTATVAAALGADLIRR